MRKKGNCRNWGEQNAAGKIPRLEKLPNCIPFYRRRCWPRNIFYTPKNFICAKRKSGERGKRNKRERYRESLCETREQRKSFTKLNKHVKFFFFAISFSLLLLLLLFRENEMKPWQRNVKIFLFHLAAHKNINFIYHYRMGNEERENLNNFIISRDLI
jgi:hypothetical protein